MQRGNMAARNYRAMNKSTLHVRFEISFLNSYDMTLLKEKYSIAGRRIAVFMMKYLIERRTDCRAPHSMLYLKLPMPAIKVKRLFCKSSMTFLHCSKSTATIKYFSVHICSSFSAIILQIMKSQTEV